MNQSLPDYFGVPVFYINKNLLGIMHEIISEHKTCTHTPEITVNRNKIVIGISLPNVKIPRWIRDKETFEYYTNSKDITSIIKNANYDSNLQSKQVDELISKGVNVLIIAPLDSYGIGTQIEKDIKAGFKVISYDGLLYNCNPDLYISFDGTKVGELQGKFLIENAPKGNYIILSGDPTDDTSNLYKDGAMEYILPLVHSGAIKIVADAAVADWNANIAYEIVKNSLIMNNNQVNAVLAPTDEIAEGVVKALEEQSLAGKVLVTGQDADPKAIKRIIAGTQSMTVLKDSRELAKAAIDSAIKLVNGQYISTNAVTNNGKTDIPSLIFTPIVVTRNNIADTIIKTGFLKSSEIYD